MEAQTITKTYLPKKERVSGGISFHLTLRDMEILKAANRYRYLRSGQIKRLIFPENKSIQSAHRRLKLLFHNKLLGRIQPLIRPGHGSAETAYFLDKAGRELLEIEGEELIYYSKSKLVGPHFLAHALDLSEFRLNLELATKDHPVVSLKRFTADFEIKSHAQGANEQENLKLFSELKHPKSGESYTVFPDALIVFQGKGIYEGHQKLYFLEVDRGTESLLRIRKKVIGYRLYFKQRIFSKFGKFEGFTVLFQTNSSLRAENIRKDLSDLEGTELIWITNDKKINEKTILHAPIWLDHELKLRSIVKTREKEKI